MKGFLFGSFALIVLEVLVQPGAASKAEQGGNLLVQGLQRMLSPQVAAIKNRGGTTGTVTD